MKWYSSNPVFGLILVLLLLNLATSPSHSQTQKSDYWSENLTLKWKLKECEKFIPPQVYKRVGHYSKKDWQTLIDSVWGSGLPTSQKLEIFDNAWNIIDSGYAAFQNFNVNMDSLRDLYRPEIESGVSRGRFASIMNYLSFAMKECHTVIMDIPVNWGTPITQGTPLFVIGPWCNNSRFGATLSPLPDSSLLVYKALPNHTLGLVAGDIVLGYDGIPWKILCKELLDAMLPIHLNWVWGSNDESITHCILSSAGLNWHLFDTIDILKYETGDTIHLPTNLLENQYGTIWGNEQLEIPGVGWPNILEDDYISWGIIEETQIGYIYVTAWTYDPQYEISQQFYNAIDSLMQYYQTSGMIIDFRLNYGGGLTSDQGFSLLFDSTFYTVGFDVRCGDPHNHYSMCSHSYFTPFRFRINGNPTTYYNKPIAVLTGPATVSAGDLEAVRIGFHPNVKLFGKSSSGAFCSASYPDLGNPDWYFYLSTSNAYLVSNHQYLAHSKLNMYKEIWLSQEGVIEGKDDVVEAAIEWINNTSAINEELNEVLDDYYLSQNYPNPFNIQTKIKYKIPESGFITLRVYDVLGRVVAELVNEESQAGSYDVDFNAFNLSTGIYFYSIQTENFRCTKKMLLLR